MSGTASLKEGIVAHPRAQYNLYRRNDEKSNSTKRKSPKASQAQRLRRWRQHVARPHRLRERQVPKLERSGCSARAKEAEDEVCWGGRSGECSASEAQVKRVSHATPSRLAQPFPALPPRRQPRGTHPKQQRGGAGDNGGELAVLQPGSEVHNKRLLHLLGRRRLQRVRQRARTCQQCAATARAAQSHTSLSPAATTSERLLRAERWSADLATQAG